MFTTSLKICFLNIYEHVYTFPNSGNVGTVPTNNVYTPPWIIRNHVQWAVMPEQANLAHLETDISTEKQETKWSLNTEHKGNLLTFNSFISRFRHKSIRW